MHRKNSFTTLMASLTIVSASPALASVVNGDFEDTTGLSFDSAGFVAAPPPGWTDAGNADAITGNTYNGQDFVEPHDGTTSGFASGPSVTVDLNENILEQVITGLSGEQVLSFTFLNIGIDGSFGDGLVRGGARVLDSDGTTVLGTFTSSTLSEQTSENGTINFTASGSEATIQFYTFVSTNSFFGASVDDVSVAPVPEPGSLALLGLSGLLVLRRRRS